LQSNQVDFDVPGGPAGLAQAEKNNKAGQDKTFEISHHYLVIVFITVNIYFSYV